MQKKNLSIRDYGEIYGPGRSKTYELIAEGKLKTIKYGRRRLITAEEHRASLLAEAEG